MNHRLSRPVKNSQRKNLHFPQSLFPIGIFPMEPQLRQIRVCRMKYGSYSGKTFWKVSIPDASTEYWFPLPLYTWTNKDRLYQGDYFILYLKNDLKKNFDSSNIIFMHIYVLIFWGWVGVGLNGCITFLKILKSSIEK